MGSLAMLVGVGVALLLGLGVQSVSAAPSATQAKAASPIVIGDVSDESGLLSSTGDAWLPGLRAWVSYVNAHGGILGHQVKLIALDTGSNPTTAIADVKKLIADHVTAFIPGDAQGVAPIASLIGEKFPAIGGYLDDTSWDTKPYVFAEGTTALSSGYAASYAAVSAGKKKAVDFYCAEAAACAASIPLFEAGAKEAGAQWTSPISISASAPNYTAQCLAAQSRTLTM